ncbi:MAG: tRNA pseudouridine(55) synthase TruB [Candidatus Paceibacterota bacterium]
MDEIKLPELLLIDKEKGISSFTVIRKLRKLTGIRKFGHAGTLDPLATGLMLIGVEKGTKKLTELVGLDKEYVAEVLIGERRSTGDMEGEVLEERAYQNDLDTEKVQSVLNSMLGDLTLQVSAYSAIKKDGVPMYKRARQAEKKGEVVTELPVRVMKVYEAELIEFNIMTDIPNRLLCKVRFKVSSGTYIRSLAEELGRRLGYPATLANLRRTKIGDFKIEDAKRVEDFDKNTASPERRRGGYVGYGSLMLRQTSAVTFIDANDRVQGGDKGFKLINLCFVAHEWRKVNGYITGPRRNVLV